ncbi:MAG: LolA family protein, partial [Desulfatiglandales bacterium]
MKGIRERYPKGKLLRAEYVRVTATKIGSLVGSEQEEKASGLLFFKAPHQLRLEQDLPEKELLISDGERIYWYLLSKAEVHVYDLEGNTSLVKTISDIFQGMEEGSRI